MDTKQSYARFLIRSSWLATLLLCMLIPPAQAIDSLGVSDDDLLDPDAAFAIHMQPGSDGQAEVSWKIAPGYYMYRDRIRFMTDTPGYSLGTPILPEGKIKDDEFFGKIAIFRDQVTARIPVRRTESAGDTFELKAVSQGCADVGVCYPPHTQTAALTLAAAPAAATTGTQPGGLLGSIVDKPGLLATDDDFLEPDVAFQADVYAESGNQVRVHWVIAEGYYLYRDKLSIKVAEPADIKISQTEIPPGDTKHDEFFGDVQVFHHEASALLTLDRPDQDPREITLQIGYQGCAEAGICYPPIKKTLSVMLEAGATSANTTAAPPAAKQAAQATANTEPLSEQDSIAKRLAEGNIWATLVAFFGFGLLLAFTPCVFPMIPILSSIIVGQGDRMTARHGFVLSTVYVLAMAATYTVAGVIAGLFGENLQAAFQNPWILSTFAAVFVLLSLSMFGFYELQMPAALQGRLTEISNRQKGGNLLGVAVMGFLSALIVGPCVAAPLAGALIFIGQTGDAVLGGLALFALSLGMGAPLIAIGTGAGKLLPRAGAWMDAVKAVFGVMLLAVAIWMLERILPAVVTLLLWSALLIISAVYLGAWSTLPADASGWRKLWKGTGLILFIYGVLLLIGAVGGASDPLRPLQPFEGGAIQGSTATTQEHLPFVSIKTGDDLQRELDAARAQGKPVMLDFYADWCVSCKEMEKYTFADTRVRQALDNYRLLQADVTANDEADKALLKRFNLFGPPGIIFWDASGNERKALQLVGFKPADAFLEHLGK